MEEFDSGKLFENDSLGGGSWMNYSGSNNVMDALEDLPSFLDRELDSMDMETTLCTDTQIPMLEDPLLPLCLSDRLEYDDGLLSRSDSDSGLSTDSGCAALTFKTEPLSPTSSFSSDSSDSHQFSTSQFPITSDGISDVDLDLFNYLSSGKDPPLTPPYEPRDKLSSNHNSQLTSVVVKQSNSRKSPVKVKLANQLQAKSRLANQNAAKGVTSSALTAGARVTVVQQTPSVTTLSSSTKINGKTTTKPIVLTADEFQRLASTGVLRFQNPAQNKIKPDNNPVSVKPNHNHVVTNGNAATVVKQEPVANDAVMVAKAPVTVATSKVTLGDESSPPSYVKTEVDLRTWKRQQRMIKNRESACLSRKRKKEHLQNLEDQLSRVQEENEVLRQENEILKHRIDLLQSENEKFRRKFSGKAVCLLAVAFLFCLNLGPLSALLPSAPSPGHVGSLTNQRADHVMGRHLLSLRDLPSSGDSLNQSNFKSGEDFQKRVEELRETMNSWNETHHNVLLMKSLEALSTFNDCPSYFNKTESLRLANVLTGWVQGHEKAERRPAHSTTLNRPKFKRKIPKKYRSLRVFKKMDSHNTDQNHRRPYQMQLFRNQERSYTDFLDAINRRNDTFYVVSFRKDHLLLPALAHNKTMRPRMSLVMPAVSLNSTLKPPDGSVTMMQIDCEVMDTRLIHVVQSAVPDQSRDSTSQSENATASNFPDDDTVKFNAEN